MLSYANLTNEEYATLTNEQFANLAIDDTQVVAAHVEAMALVERVYLMAKFEPTYNLGLEGNE